METANVLSIYHDSVVDGEGLRTVIFFAGCPHHCIGCHNPESWNKKSGKSMRIDEIVKEAINPLTDITLSGGDPFFQANAVTKIAKQLKTHGKNIWAYTGWTLEEIVGSGDPDKLELLETIDVLVDGPFLLKERDLTLSFRGSRNQRIIDLKSCNYS